MRRLTEPRGSSAIPSRTHVVSTLGLAVGLGVLIALVAWQGLHEVAGLLLDSGGWLMLVPLVWLPSLLPAVASWQLLFPPTHRPPFLRTARALWIGRAINSLLPVASVGGEVAKARLMVLWGSPAVESTASVVMDTTVQAVALVLWGLCGAVVLSLLALDGGVVPYALLGLLALGAGIAGFVLAQYRGIFAPIHRRAGKILRSPAWQSFEGPARAVDHRIRTMYTNERRRVVAAVLLRGFGLSLQTAEVWVAATLLGHPLGLAEAFALKSVSSVLSDIAFVVPNAYGVQEGAYVVLGALFGQPPELMLALSLATRIREIVVDVPGLLAWSHVEGNAFVERRRRRMEA